MTPEARTKARETQRLQREQWATQTVTIDKDWRIIRSDELNWEIQYKGKFQGFYGTLPQALQSLPAKMLGEEAKGSLKAVLASQKGILQRIEDSMRDS